VRELTTKQISYTALFAAIGIVLPQVFHIFGGTGLGSMLLPMHLPVFIGAMLLGPISGLFIAWISVITGVLLGMPPMPIAIFMFFELSVYGLVSGWLFHTLKWNVFVSYGVAKIAGMAVSLLSIHVALLLFTLQLPPVFGTLSMFVVGIPGIAIQIIVVPLTVLRLRGVVTIEHA
jgi:niacin transporter